MSNARTRPWLPDAALRDATLRNRIAATASAWSRRWFSEPTDVSVQAITTPARTRAEVWGDAGSRLSTDSTIALARRLLGIEKQTRKTSNADERLFRRLGSSAAADLSASLEDAFARVDRPSSTPHAESCIHFTIAILGADIAFQLDVSAAVAVLSRKAAIATPRRRRPSHPRSEAIHAQTVRVGAMIGASRMGLSDFLALRPGDVAVLDRGEDDVALTVDGRACAGARCALRWDDSGVTLRVNQLEGMIAP